MAWWNRRKNKPAEVEETRDFSLADLLQANADVSTITAEQAMSIPALNAAVNLISNTVASLPVRLYRREGQKISAVDDDPRVELLNGTTGDLLDGFQMKKAFVDDHLVHGAGYLYINKVRNGVKSLHYVSNPQVGVVLVDPNPIFKKMEFFVYGSIYQDFQFVKMTRKTKNGITGIGVVAEANKMLSVAYNTLLFEDMLVRTGGNKKGFLKSASKLTQEALDNLKAAFKRLYSNNTDNIVVLNSGLDFQESTNSAVEMQINQNKITNAEEIAKLLHIPVELLNGKATGGNEMLYDSFIKLAILPIIKAFETALNKDLLLEKEKGSFYFAFDMNELLKADVLKRFQAYEIAIRNSIFDVDEIRAKENYAPRGLKFIKLGLQDVLFNPETQEIYTPNTNQVAKMGKAIETMQPEGTDPLPAPEGGDDNANRDSGEQSGIA
ncbi:phage portal protein [Ectobacillus ponti]|uniref:Phage portal protein n=1 Tax=Ectobacillus ponti TaxID=2961894 RepID=A0AA42BQB9_9BACI|nr:phage portal protein [Ectobacillus ponti]MCP8969717.1 phage portal protein [Ectobacillus ponti]